MSADNRSGPECTGMGLELPYLSDELPCSDLLNPDPVFSSGSDGLTEFLVVFRWFSSCVPVDGDSEHQVTLTNTSVKNIRPLYFV